MPTVRLAALVTRPQAEANRRAQRLTTPRRDVNNEVVLCQRALPRDAQGPHFSAQSMETDHSFDDHRIALQAAILKWLALR
jgi:hypothetical protein